MIERFPNERHLFGVHQGGVGSRRAAGRIDGPVGLGIVGLQRDNRLTATPFGSVLLLTVVACFVCSDAKQPGLDLTVSFERPDVLDDGKRGFLANFLDVLGCELGRKLKHKASRGSVVKVENRIPSLSVALATTGQQLGFRGGSHREEYRNATRNGQSSFFAGRFKLAKPSP